MQFPMFDGERPLVHETAYVADGAVLIGQVEICAEASIWFQVVLRGDTELIRIGKGSNVQDGVVIHTDPDFPCVVKDFVSIGHNAILHGCSVDQGATIGMGATVLNGARVGEGALVAANALVLEGMEIPSRTLVAGIPAKLKRELTIEEVDGLFKNAENYIQRRAKYLKIMRSDVG